MHGIDKLTTRGVLAMIASHIIDTHGAENVQLDDEANDGTYIRLYFRRRLFDFQIQAINQVAKANGNSSEFDVIGVWEYAIGFAISEHNLVILNPYTKPSIDDKYNICDPAFDISAVYESCEEHILEHLRQVKHK